ncbi:hypothetical protein SASPL_129536 [Salvia splendens]|uniref:Uncharacterized protein n=1 Tax=Salvia splendens TaxID=180675 RepID=A0A8X8XEL4_SALSN|nr:hypothetical protein SASPL_129536 [Salvia splendens]
MKALKSVTSPKRLFFTTYPAVNKLDEFASNIDKEVSEIPHFAWGDIDMVFFAFCVSKRYYTMCFCFKRKSVVIIDACKDGEDNDLRFTYGNIPEALCFFETCPCGGAARRRAVEELVRCYDDDPAPQSGSSMAAPRKEGEMGVVDGIEKEIDRADGCIRERLNFAGQSTETERMVAAAPS